MTGPLKYLCSFPGTLLQIWCCGWGDCWYVMPFRQIASLLTIEYLLLVYSRVHNLPSNCKTSSSHHPSTTVLDCWALYTDILWLVFTKCSILHYGHFGIIPVYPTNLLYFMECLCRFSVTQVMIRNLKRKRSVWTSLSLDFFVLKMFQLSEKLLQF